MKLARLDRDRGALIRSIRSSPIAAIVTDARAPDNPIIAVNQAFERLTGYEENELIGRNCRILAGSGTEAAGSAVLRHAITTASPAVVELINYRKDGTKFLNAVMIAPVLDDRGEPAFFVGSQMEVGPNQRDPRLASAAARLNKLTAQQQAVLRLMARGLRNRQIAEVMGLTEKTIKMHRSGLVKRLGLSHSAEAIRLAIEAGF
jgi:PAS domain S-box-containing protein